LDVSRKKSKYSQLLLAAKIHDESKIEAIQKPDEFSHVSGQIAEQRSKMQESLKQLKALYNADENLASTEIKDQEVNYEASI